MSDARLPAGDATRDASHDFYRRVLARLDRSGIPYLIGGAYAVRHYTGIDRCTRDCDVFLRPDDVPAALEHLANAGFQTELTFAHWLGKVREGGDYVDLIFSSGNGLARVDDAWFQHASQGQVLEHAVRFCPVEEMIWSKAYIMERERFDGADVLHLIRATKSMDWERLRARFGPHRRVLLAHLLLFGFVFPADRARVPEQLLQDLFAESLEEDLGADCLGTLLSRSQYVPDLEHGHRDGRLPPHGAMSPSEIQRWTDAADLPLPHAIDEPKSDGTD